MSPAPRPVLIAACGNILAGDDAFGPLVAERLREMDLPGVEVLDLGLQPAGLACQLADRTAVVVVDAASAPPDFPPGQLIDLDFFDPRRPPLLHDSQLSSHGLAIAHELELARRLQWLPPRVRLIAAPLAACQWGSPPSPQVRALIDPAAQRAADWARQWADSTGRRKV